MGEGPFVLAKDWFDVRFEPSSLGTVVSHLAFSLHFLHHHWHSGERAYEYARKYMELLHALVPGGRLVYAPGLPFIEEMLDTGTFNVERRELPAPLQEKMEGLRDSGDGAERGLRNASPTIAVTRTSSVDSRRTIDDVLRRSIRSERLTTFCVGRFAASDSRRLTSVDARYVSGAKYAQRLSTAR
ncbi:MAG: hypothetical protein QM784_38615 [Polyangiaceae bacterium]